MKAIYVDCTGDLAGRYDDEMRRLMPDLEVNFTDPPADELPALLAGYAGVLNGHTYMPAALLAALPALEVIVFLGTGAGT